MAEESKLKRYTCLRCGHTWIPRSDNRPVRCANTECRSPYWDIPRKEKNERKGVPE